MSFADFELKRTLTDVLEDELYHINMSSTTTTPTTTSINNGNNTVVPPNDSVDTNMLSLDNSNDSNHNDNYLSANDGIYPHQFTNVYNMNNYHYNNNPIFSSYADPTLTTTTATMRNYIASVPESMAPSSPISSIGSHNIQGTVNLNSISKWTNTHQTATPHSFYTNNGNNHMNTLYNVKISPDNSLYPPILEDNEYMSCYDDFPNDKLDSIPLEDNNSILNMDNARMIFDQEFSDDDFEDDEEDEDDNVFDMAPASAFSMTSDYPSYYPGDMYLPITNELNKSAIIDDDEEEGDREEQRDIDTGNYPQESGDINHTNNNSNNIVEPLVFDHESLKSERSKLISLKNRPELTFSRESGKHLESVSRKPLSFVDNNNTTNHKRRVDTEKKKRTRGARSLNNTNHGSNEIYTCRLVNLVTNEPCMAQFSRSYDLTRHQNTIHAKKKIVFRCSECIKALGDEGYSKTFSRLDALTRHIKLKHGELTPEQRKVVTKYAKENIGYVV